MGIFRYSIQMQNCSHFGTSPAAQVRLVKALRNSFEIGLKDAKDISDSLLNGEVAFRDYTVQLSRETIDAMGSVYGVLIIVLESFEFENTTNSIVFVVRKNTDMTEGRGPMMADSIFTTRFAAEEYIGMQYGIMGSKDGSGWDVKEMPLYTTAVQREQDNIAAQKARALNKLTPAERKLLGV